MCKMRLDVRSATKEVIKDMNEKNKNIEYEAADRHFAYMQSVILKKYSDNNSVKITFTIGGV